MWYLAISNLSQWWLKKELRWFVIDTNLWFSQARRDDLFSLAQGTPCGRWTSKQCLFELILPAMQMYGSFRQQQRTV